MEELSVRPFEERDWPDMVRFYEEFYRPGYVFTRRAFFDWNFSSPLRPDDRSGQRLALDGDRIVGIMGSLPWPLQVAGRRELGEYNINLFVDPAYRGSRVGQQLLASVSSGYAYSLTNGYNARTLSMYQRLGRVHHWAMRRFVKCLDADRTEKLLTGSPRFSQLEPEDRAAALDRLRESAALSLGAPELSVAQQRGFDVSWDRAWDEMRGLHGFTTWRSSAFLNWRYVAYPSPLYACFTASPVGSPPRGLCVLRVESPPCGVVVRIVDLVGSAASRRALLAHAQQLAAARSAIFVDYVSAGETDDALLASAGYRELYAPDGAMLLPMDFAPLRHRDQVLALASFLDIDDAGSHEFEAGRFYVVKGDGDLDRANQPG